jgi:hypothetical protein
MKTRLRAGCRGFARSAQPPSPDDGVGEVTTTLCKAQPRRGQVDPALAVRRTRGFSNQNLNSWGEACLMVAVPRQTRAGYLLVRRRALVCFGDGLGATDGPVTNRVRANEEKCRPGHLRNRATRAPLLASQRCLLRRVSKSYGTNTARWFNGFTCFEKITSND